jgi:hypothetical protein
MEKAEMYFLRVVVGYRMTDHKCNEDIRVELDMTDNYKYFNKNYQNKCVEYLEIILKIKSQSCSISVSEHKMPGISHKKLNSFYSCSWNRPRA